MRRPRGTHKAEHDLLTRRLNGDLGTDGSGRRAHSTVQKVTRRLHHQRVLLVAEPTRRWLHRLLRASLMPLHLD